MKLFKKKNRNDCEVLNKTIREQKARIEELKHENADLLYTLDEYTKKENSILESIGYLEEKKREQTKSLNIKYALELERLNFFENKWLNLVKTSHDPSLKRQIAFTRDTLAVCRDEILTMTRSELKISKAESLAEADYEAETYRLNTLPKAETGEEIFNEGLSDLSQSPVAKQTSALRSRYEKLPLDTPPTSPSPQIEPPKGIPLPTSTKKMSDNEIVSLLEKLSL